MEQKQRMEKVKNALLSMQRYSWEQGVAAQAFLELGDQEMAILFAKEAVVRQMTDGRPAMIGNSAAVTDPAAVGEALVFAAEATKEENLKAAVGKMVDWLLVKAPKNGEGAIYHIHDRPQIWVDSFYMAPPALAAAGYPKEAMQQVEAYRRVLYNPEKKMYSHIWDDHMKFVRKDFWGVGNGWAMAGMTRLIRLFPDTMAEEKNRIKDYIKENLDGCLPYIRKDGLFHDVIDHPDTFVETNFPQMLAYTIYRGVQGKWLDQSYLQYADKMRQAVQEKVDDYGLVQGVCGSPYFDRPGTAAEGQAFYLLMETAASDLED